MKIILQHPMAWKVGIMLLNKSKVQKEMVVETRKYFEVFHVPGVPSPILTPHPHPALFSAL